jgi:hypothetical protein
VFPFPIFVTNKTQLKFNLANIERGRGEGGREGGEDNVKKRAKHYVRFSNKLSFEMKNSLLIKFKRSVVHVKSFFPPPPPYVKCLNGAEMGTSKKRTMLSSIINKS